MRNLRGRLNTASIGVLVAVLAAFLGQEAAAQSCSTTSFPYTLTSGSAAIAAQVMANLTCAPIYGLANWSGNVGIGITSPSAPLDVGGGGYLHLAGSTGPTVTIQGAYFSWNVTGGLGETDFINNRGGGPGGFYFLNSTALTSPLMFIAASGNVGIGTTNPGSTLQVNGGITATGGDAQAASAGPSISMYENGGTGFIYSLYQLTSWEPFVVGASTFSFMSNGATLGFYQNVSGNVGIGTTSPAYPLFVNGQAGGSTSWANTSDMRLKKNIVEITDSLQLVQKLRGVRFDWKSRNERTVGKKLNLPQGEHEIGFVAQEVAKVIPEAVQAPKPGKDSLYSVKEADLIPLLVEAIKEQQQEIKEQQRALAKLQSLVAALQPQLSKHSQ